MTDPVHDAARDLMQFLRLCADDTDNPWGPLIEIKGVRVAAEGLAERITKLENVLEEADKTPEAA